LMECISNHAKATTITAKSWLVVENGKISHGENTTEVRAIGSITKLVTAMVYLDAYGSPTTKRDQDLFQRMIVHSDNRAAKTLCSKVPDCILLMNLKARELGLSHTRFTEPSGLSVFNSSNAEELVKIVETASTYTDIVSASRISKGNTNPTIKKYHYDVSKTGYIRLAGGCIAAKVNDKIIVILGSKNVKTRIVELEHLIKI
jgi:D-alanyl-D-alanine endopeptidase (penicillin-binding protein 7)